MLAFIVILPIVVVSVSYHAEYLLFDYILSDMISAIERFDIFYNQS